MAAIIGKDLAVAYDLLKRGNLVAIPTETVYGLAGNAFDQNAVISIFEAKKRPRFNPLILHTHSIEEAEKLVVDFPSKARLLAEKNWPGPLTLLLPKAPIIPDLITAGSPRVAIRIPKHPLTLQLLKMCDFPLAAPSANPFGYISPTRPEHVQQQLGGVIPYILDGGPCGVGIESTIIGFEEGMPKIFRLGGMALEEIQNLVGEVLPPQTVIDAPQTSGMLKSHYAPATPLYLGNIPEMLEELPFERVGILSFEKDYSSPKKKAQVILAPNGKMEEAAKNLFSALRRLDDKGLEAILAERAPEEGLGLAINDRLEKSQVLNKK